MAITWLLYIGVRRRACARNNVMVVIKLLVSALASGSGAMHVDPCDVQAVRAERLARHPPGRGNRVLRLHRVRRMSTAAEETKNPQRNMPIGISAASASAR